VSDASKPRKRWLSPDVLEPVLYLGLTAAGLTGAAFALFLGKLFGAAVLAAISVGFFVRFKRGRVKAGGSS
jgi:hypothetical protein